MARVVAFLAVIIFASMLGTVVLRYEPEVSKPADDLSLYLRANPRGVPVEAPN